MHSTSKSVAPLGYNYSMKSIKVRRVIITLLLLSVVIASLSGALVVLEMAEKAIVLEALWKTFSVFGIVALACVAFIALLETSKD